ncbi:hypothetical protein [Clostridium guangxiense]|uniref:hypothetical protein n=1 Tax=Clostridium guangxiense TaxID=1662055 RepID=UPI001E4B564E|nr:hypothetical protein [Clostridium guangxiense]MCD2346466.1 hypothetical protein [Clostridium guangxiense]
MQKITQRDKKILIVLAAVIVLFVYCQFVLLPSLKSISQSKSAINDLELKENQMEMTKLQNLTMKKKLKKITDEYNDSQSKLPINERNPEIEYDIQNIAANSKVTVSSMIFGDVKLFDGFSSDKNEQIESNNSKKNGDLMQIPVNISVVGNDEDSVMSFLKSIESTNRISEIDNANIILNSDDSQNKKFTLSVTVSYFYIVSKDKNNVQYNFGSGN